MHDSPNPLDSRVAATDKAASGSLGWSLIARKVPKQIIGRVLTAREATALLKRL